MHSNELFTQICFFAVWSISVSKIVYAVLCTLIHLDRNAAGNAPAFGDRQCYQPPVAAKGLARRIIVSQLQYCLFYRN